jgi:hypothetical protein
MNLTFEILHPNNAIFSIKYSDCKSKGQNRKKYQY